MFPKLQLAAIVGLANIHANAFITGISVPTATLKVTPTSAVNVKFTTSNSPTTAVDFALTCLLAPSSDNVSGSSLGESPLQTYNLVALGHSRTGTGSFQLSVPINTANAGGFHSGTFTLSCGTLSAFGALFGAQSNVFHTSIKLKI